MNKIRAEAFDIMQNFYRTAHEPLIRCMMCFSGQLDADALLRAVDLSVAAVPPLACRFDSETHSWKENGFSAKNILQVVSERESNTAEKLLLSKINFEHEPQLKLFLVRGETDDTLCVIISHLVADGAGFKQYLYLLAELYSRCVENPVYHTAPQPGDRTLGQLLRGYSFREKKSIFTAKPEMLREDASEFPPLKGDGKRPFVVRCVLEKDLLATAKAYGKSRNASINDLLLTAFVRAVSGWTGSSHIEFPCPVDIRKYLKDRESCGICNMTSNYLCKADIPAGELFDGTLRNISEHMTVQKKNLACLKGPALLNVLFHILPYSILHGLFSKLFVIPVVSYTNMGILDEKRLFFAGVKVRDAFLSTAVKHAPYFQVAVSTWQGNCSLCSSFYGTPDDEKQICDFLNSMKREILSAIGC